MAQQTQILLTCDICGGDKPGQETVNFGVDGGQYEIDLCEKHAKQLRDGVAQYVGAARRVSTRGGGRRASGGTGRGAGDRQRTQEIREWARSKGIKVSERGRLSADVVAQFDKAKGR